LPAERISVDDSKVSTRRGFPDHDRADINVIDYDRQRLRAPEVVSDLPSGGVSPRGHASKPCGFRPIRAIVRHMAGAASGAQRTMGLQEMGSPGRQGR
jgi:N-acyl-D-aspartate/D-glutamate deacylase